MNGLPLEFKLKKDGKVVGFGAFYSLDKKYGYGWGVTREDDGAYLSTDDILYDEMCQFTGFTDNNGKKVYFGDNISYGEAIYVVGLYEREPGNMYIGAIDEKNGLVTAIWSKYFGEMELVEG